MYVYGLLRRGRISETGLAGLSDLARVELQGNDIEDISVFSDKTNLWYLRIDFNDIEDLTPLSDNVDFKGPGTTLNINGLPLDCDAQEPKIQTIRDRNVTVHYSPCG